MAVGGGVCPAILPGDRQLLLHAAQRREHSDRRWQIGHASCKALAARPHKSFSGQRKARPTRSVQALRGVKTGSAEKISACLASTWLTLKAAMLTLKKR